MSPQDAERVFGRSKSVKLIKECKRCISKSCDGCPVDAEIHSILTSDKVLAGVLRDIK